MIVITGAAGFIGSAIASTLNQRGHTDLLLVDELGQGEQWKNLISLQYADYLEKDTFLEFIQTDSSFLSSVEAVFHLGACSSTTEADASYLVKNNFEYTKCLATWCLSKGVRFVYASSAATYGDGSQGYKDEESAIHSLRPLNMYGYSKQMFDQWAIQQGILSKVVGLKYFNVYGPNEYHKEDMKSMVAKAYQQILESGKVKLFQSHHPDYRDGEQLRDFIYIKEAVEKTLFFLDSSIPGGLYNVGTGKARSWLDMMRALFVAMNKEPSIEFIPMPKTLQGKYQYYTQAEMGKLLGVGYSGSTYSLEEGVTDYVRYLENQSHLENL